MSFDKSLSFTQWPSTVSSSSDISSRNLYSKRNPPSSAAYVVFLGTASHTLIFGYNSKQDSRERETWAVKQQCCWHHFCNSKLCNIAQSVQRFTRFIHNKCRSHSAESFHTSRHSLIDCRDQPSHPIQSGYQFSYHFILLEDLDCAASYSARHKQQHRGQE